MALTNKRGSKRAYTRWIDRYDVQEVERAQKKFRTILNETDNRTLDAIGRDIIRLRDGKIDKDRLRRHAEELYRRQFGNRSYILRLETIERRIANSFKQTLRQIPLDDGTGLPFPQNTRRIINERVRLLRRGMSKTSAVRIANRVDAVIRKNMTLETVRRGVKQQLRSARPARSKLIAQTEVTSLRNEITLQALKEEGYKYKVWNTQLDSRVRPAHRRLHGQRRLLRTPFRVKYPKQQATPLPAPNEPGCRCFITNE